MFRYIKLMLVFCMISTYGLLSSTGCHYDGMKTKVKLEEKILCAATGVTKTSAPGDSVMSLDIPSNAAITKLYVSIWQEPGMPIDSANLTIIGEPGTIFNLDFSKDPNEKVGNYETTFIQPLCIGEEEFAVAVLAAYSGQSLGAPHKMQITVIYCPDYCLENGCD